METPPPAQPARRPPAQLVEHFFRHETGRLHGTLLRLVGIQRLQLAEDVAQEAMLRALRVWSMGGVPPNPAAWITRTAINLARDALRHERMASGKEAAIALYQTATVPLPPPAAAWHSGQLLRDDSLRLLFVCGHPAIAPDAQVILALKVICGFNVAEIAAAFFATESAIEKQLTRTRRRIQAGGIPFEIPEGEDLGPRLDGVLGTLYLLFNEGYKASAGPRLLRGELCQEAIRLAQLLVAHPAGNTPRAHALLSLMLLTAARFPSRLDEQGALLRLDAQDRSRWDQRLIDQGLLHLARGARGASLSVYHLQAAIAAVHVSAPDAASTDWRRIVSLYDALLRLRPSPVAALNRAVALAQLEGPGAGLAALDQLPEGGRLASHYLLHAVRGEFYHRLGDRPAATAAWHEALALASTEPERAFLTSLLGDGP